MMFKEYRKTATVKAKLFEKGDEDGMTTPENFTMLDAMENDKYGIQQPNMVPYIATLENQKHRGEFGKHYLCIGVNSERWLVEKGIFEKTYELVLETSPLELIKEASELMQKLLPPDQFGEDYDCERLHEIIMSFASIQHHADQLAEVLREADKYLSEVTYEHGKPVYLNNIGAYSILHKQMQTALTNYEQNNKTK